MTICRRGASTPCAQPYAPNSPHKTLNAPGRRLEVLQKSQRLQESHQVLVAFP